MASSVGPVTVVVEVWFLLGLAVYCQISQKVRPPYFELRILLCLLLIPVLYVWCLACSGQAEFES